jgi:hypothetical protein
MDVTPVTLALAWNVGVGVIFRVQDLHCALQIWIHQQYQELLPQNAAIRSFLQMVKILTAKVGLAALVDRWYYKHYPARCFFTK